jgi:hypothetical protein
MRMRTSKLLLAAVVAVTGLVACGPEFDRLELTSTKTSPLGGEVSTQRISVPEGMIVKTNVAPYDDDNEKMPGRVYSRDGDIVEVIAVVNDRDYAFIGKKVGHTEIVFEADGETVLIVQADVTPQPAPAP